MALGLGVVSRWTEGERGGFRRRRRASPEGRMRALPTVYSLLGPLQVARDGQPLPLGGAKQRAVLAVLLAAGGRVVPVPSLLDAVWDGEPGDKAEGTLQVYISALRRCLGDEGSAIKTRPPGYQLRVDDDGYDLAVFRRLREQGKQAASRGDYNSATALFGEALSMWRGAPLADLAGLRFADQLATALDEERVSVVEHKLEAALALGVSAELVSELRQLTREYPLRERLWGYLVLALYRSGRQADALAAYQEVAARLRDELGLEPSADLRTLHRKVLQQDPELAPVPSKPALLSTLRVSPAPPPRGVLVQGERRIPLDGRRMTLGRHPESDVVLDDPRVSREHAEIVLISDELVVVDRGSTNGTAVNGNLVRQHVLRHGDEIRVGGALLQFEDARRDEAVEAGAG